MVFITTQSEEAPAGVFKDELLKARGIRDGTRTAPMLPVLYEFPKAMQQDQDAWRDPKNWPLVTPNAGRSLEIDELVKQFDVAQATSEESLRTWASQHLNVEIGLALHSDRWAGADYWEGRAVKPFTIDELIARCEVIDVGYDGGGLRDLLGLCVLGRDKITRDWVVWTHAWAHPSVLKYAKADSARFRDYAADGHLTIVEVIGADTAEAASIVAHIYRSGKLDKIGVDHYGLGTIVEDLVKAGVPQEIIIGIPQNWKLNSAIKTTERKLAEGGLVHGGQPMMNWVIGNAKVEPKGNAISITKQASGFAKIDPLMALFDAVTLMALNPSPAASSEPQLLFV